MKVMSYRQRRSTLRSLIPAAVQSDLLSDVLRGFVEGLRPYVSTVESAEHTEAELRLVVGTVSEYHDALQAARADERLAVRQTLQYQEARIQELEERLRTIRRVSRGES